METKVKEVKINKQTQADLILLGEFITITSYNGRFHKLLERSKILE